MASEMLSKVLDAENSDKEAQKAAQRSKRARAQLQERRLRPQRKRKKSSRVRANRRVQTRRKLKRRQGSASAKCLRLPKRTEPRQSERLWRR